RLVERFAQTNPILLAQPTAHFAYGLEPVRLFIVNGGQQGPDAQPRPHPATAQVADHHHVYRIAQLAAVSALEVDPVVVSRPGLVAAVEALGDNPFQPALYLLVEEFLKLDAVIRHHALNQVEAFVPFG